MYDGCRVANRYVVDRLIGSGNFGQVFHAADERGGPVAIKFLHPMFPATDGEVFLAAGRRQGSVRSPRVVEVRETGVLDEVPYHVMELVGENGRTQTMEQWRATAPDRRERLSMAAGVADGLAVAHAAGVVHGDLSPTNVLLTGANQPKIGDFGLISLVEPKPGESRTFRFAGASQYAAPERLSRPGATTMSDVYSLGVCVFVLLFDRLPVKGSSHAELYVAHFFDGGATTAAGSSELPGAAALFDRMLAREPQGRPSAAEVAYALRRLVDGGG